MLKHLEIPQRNYEMQEIHSILEIYLQNLTDSWIFIHFTHWIIFCKGVKIFKNADSRTASFAGGDLQYLYLKID